MDATPTAQGCAAAAHTTAARRAYLLSKALSRLPSATLELAEEEAGLPAPGQHYSLAGRCERLAGFFTSSVVCGDSTPTGTPINKRSRPAKAAGARNEPIELDGEDERTTERYRRAPAQSNAEVTEEEEEESEDDEGDDEEYVQPKRPRRGKPAARVRRKAASSSSDDDDNDDSSEEDNEEDEEESGSNDDEDDEEEGSGAGPGKQWSFAESKSHIGKRVRVYWDEDKAWYNGTVKSVRREDHEVRLLHAHPRRLAPPPTDM